MNEIVIALSRWQFAITTVYHFFFVPLTIGLALIVAIIQTIYYKTGDQIYKQMTQYWGKLFLINFALGVVTGIVMEFQFGMNWSEYSRFVGDIFGAPLAIEALVAFFLESTFIAVWAFGWKRLSPKAHAVSIWVVAFASNISAVWILIANSWMQHPVGYVMKDGKPVLDDFVAAVTQPYAILTILHTLASAYIVAGFFVMGISAYHLLKKQFVSIFTKSFRIALVFALIFSIYLLADKENASDVIGGVSLDDKDDLLASVLLDLSLTGTMEASTAPCQVNISVTPNTS